MHVYMYVCMCTCMLLCEHTDIACVHRYLPPHAKGIVYVCVHILRVFVRIGVKVGVLCIHVCHVCVHNMVVRHVCVHVCRVGMPITRNCRGVEGLQRPLDGGLTLS